MIGETKFGNQSSNQNIDHCTLNIGRNNSRTKSSPFSKKNFYTVDTDGFVVFTPLCAIISAFFFLGALLVCILVPLSFHYVAYNEYAFVRNKYGKTDTYGTLSSGRYFYTLNYDLIKFPATLTRISFVNDGSLKIFSNDGFQIRLNIEFWVRIPKDNLGNLYRGYSKNYINSIIGQSTLIIKNFAGTNATGNIPLLEYITNGVQIQNEMAKSLRLHMYSVMGVEVREEHFKILSIIIPNNMISQYLSSVVQKQNNFIQKYKQNVEQIVAETDTLVSSINSQTNLTITYAQTNAAQNVSNAESFANSLLAVSRSDGLKYICNKLNITNSVEKTRLFELIAKMDNPNIKFINNVNPLFVIN